jgi:hypothetical protein
MNYNRKNLVDITVFFLIQYIVITLILMYLYQGGNRLNPSDVGYVLESNYLNVLGNRVYINGEPNPFWIFYAFSMGLVGIGTSLFFYYLSLLVNHKFIQKIIILFGIISGLAYLSMYVFSPDTNFTTHMFLNKVAHYLFMVNVVLLVFSVNREKYPVIYYSLSILFLIFILRFILLFFIKKIHFDQETILHFKVIYQKILVFSQLLIASLILFRIKKNWIKYDLY